ncbi:MAG: L-2-hydroxyglutarate oxidase, partial [Flavobacteriia bacterium]|nr:L-2-hydroxyglutarate oxidase [Flavobacteriia bacterium]
LHSGLYYKPGSLKAKNCIEGKREMIAFAKEYGIAHDICGKVVVASNQQEIVRLEKIHQTGIENKIEGIERISSDQVKEIEPFVECLSGLWVPSTGIIDFSSATKKMIELALALQAESRLFLAHEVISITRNENETTIHTDKGGFLSKFMVFCSGLQADRMAKKDGLKLKEKIVPFRGDYYELAAQAQHKVKNLIYPVPDPAFPFLGVHFTRMVGGGVECGPNAVFSFKREGYNKIDFSFKDSFDALSYRGTWKLFLGNISYGINEYRRAFSKKMFLKSLQQMIPSLTMDDIEPGRAGVRAQLLSQNGDTRDDFRIEHQGNAIHVLNAPSPAATASLAIGKYIALEAEKKFGLK